MTACCIHLGNIGDSLGCALARDGFEGGDTPHCVFPLAGSELFKGRGDLSVRELRIRAEGFLNNVLERAVLAQRSGRGLRDRRANRVRLEGLRHRDVDLGCGFLDLRGASLDAVGRNPLLALEGFPRRDRATTDFTDRGVERGQDVFCTRCVLLCRGGRSNPSPLLDLRRVVENALLRHREVGEVQARCGGRIDLRGGISVQDVDRVGRVALATEASRQVEGAAHQTADHRRVQAAGVDLVLRQAARKTHLQFVLEEFGARLPCEAHTASFGKPCRKTSGKPRSIATERVAHHRGHDRFCGTIRHPKPQRRQRVALRRIAPLDSLAVHRAHADGVARGDRSTKGVTRLQCCATTREVHSRLQTTPAQTFRDDGQPTRERRRDRSLRNRSARSQRTSKHRHLLGNLIPEERQRRAEALVFDALKV